MLLLALLFSLHSGIWMWSLTPFPSGVLMTLSLVMMVGLLRPSFGREVLAAVLGHAIYDSLPGHGCLGCLTSLVFTLLGLMIVLAVLLALVA